MKKNKYITGKWCGFKDDNDTAFYMPRFGNDNNLELLLYCIGYARCKYKTFKEFKENLLQEKVLNFDIYDFLYEYAITLDPEKNEIECAFVDFYKCSQEAGSDIKVFFGEDCTEQVAFFSLSIFLEVAEKIIDYFYQAEQWIIIWQDERNHIHVEPYELTPEQYEYVKDWYKSNV